MLSLFVDRYSKIEDILKLDKNRYNRCLWNVVYMPFILNFLGFYHLFDFFLYLFIYFYSFKSLSSNNLQEKTGLSEPVMVNFILYVHFNILKDAFSINIKDVFFQHNKIEPIAAPTTIC